MTTAAQLIAFLKKFPPKTLIAINLPSDDPEIVTPRAVGYRKVKLANDRTVSVQNVAETPEEVDELIDAAQRGEVSLLTAYLYY